MEAKITSQILRITSDSDDNLGYIEVSEVGTRVVLKGNETENENRREMEFLYVFEFNDLDFITHVTCNSQAIL